MGVLHRTKKKQTGKKREIVWTRFCFFYVVENEPTSYREAVTSSEGQQWREAIKSDRHPAVIEGYSDANWISDIKDSRSTSGYVFTLGGAAISWKSSKQTVIAKSTMESEFIALDKCGEEAECWDKLQTTKCRFCC
ncbi:zinc finger, CCHC-type containing protein [Tanacetum coccineum]